MSSFFFVNESILQGIFFFCFEGETVATEEVTTNKELTKFELLLTTTSPETPPTFSEKLSPQFTDHYSELEEEMCKYQNLRGQLYEEKYLIFFEGGISTAAQENCRLTRKK